MPQDLTFLSELSANALTNCLWFSFFLPEWMCLVCRLGKHGWALVWSRGWWFPARHFCQAGLDTLSSAWGSSSHRPVLGDTHWPCQHGMMGLEGQDLTENWSNRAGSEALLQSTKWVSCSINRAAKMGGTAGFIYLAEGNSWLRETLRPSQLPRAPVKWNHFCQEKLQKMPQRGFVSLATRFQQLLDEGNHHHRLLCPSYVRSKHLCECLL